jgi:hypothetical protein
MADRGVPLTGAAVYDKDLYGADVTGYTAVAADIDEEDEVDERERAVARFVGEYYVLVKDKRIAHLLLPGCWHCWCRHAQRWVAPANSIVG